ETRGPERDPGRPRPVLERRAPEAQAGHGQAPAPCGVRPRPKIFSSSATHFFVRTLNWWKEGDSGADLQPPSGIRKSHGGVRERPASAVKAVAQPKAGGWISLTFLARSRKMHGKQCRFVSFRAIPLSVLSAALAAPALAQANSPWENAVNVLQ